MALDFGEIGPARRDPFTCGHVLRVTDFKPARVVCGLTGGEVYTNCRASVCGERPRCVYEKPDNSPAAMERRRAWIKANGGSNELE